MKARSKTFPEMSKVMAGKSEHAIRERYKELYVDVPKEFKQKAKDTDKDEVKAAEEEKKEKEPAEEDKKESPKDALIDIKETEKGKDAEVTLDQDVRKVNGKPVIYVVDGGKDGLSATEVSSSASGMVVD